MMNQTKNWIDEVIKKNEFLFSAANNPNEYNDDEDDEGLLDCCGIVASGSGGVGRRMSYSKS